MLCCCSAVCYVMRGVFYRSIPLVGCPAFPFIDQGKAGFTDGRKKRNQRQRRSFKDVGSSFSSERTPLTRQTVPGIAPSWCVSADPDRAALGVCLLMMPCSGFVSKWSRPIPPRRAARWTRVLIRDPTGSGRRSDCMSITIDDVSFLLDRSGCRMLSSRSAPEGKWRRPQHCKTNVDAHDTVRVLIFPKGL